MFENCTVKYHRNIYSGIVDSVIVTYPTTQDENGNDTWITKGIPMNESSYEYQDVLEWVAEGNTIEEAD